MATWMKMNIKLIRKILIGVPQANPEKEICGIMDCGIKGVYRSNTVDHLFYGHPRDSRKVAVNTQ